MYIISQSKKSIVNTENTIITIDNYFKIMAIGYVGKIILGKYKTEERTKEIINEIFNAINDCEYYKIQKSINYTSNYMMPEE